MDRFDWLEFDSTSDASTKNAPDAPLRAMPADGPSFYRAAREMRQAGHFRAAADFYRRSVGFDDHHYAAWVELIDTLVRAKRTEDADKTSEEILASYQQVRPLYAARALALAHLGRFDEAFPLAQVGIEDGDRSWYARCVYGELALRADPKQRTEAVSHFEQALDLANGDWEAAFLAGWALLDANLPVLAAGFLAEACHLHPRAPIGWLCLGDAFRDLKLYDQAVFYYHRVTELEPTNEIALERQKKTALMIFGLLKALRPQSLQRRWRKEIEKLSD